MNAREEKYDLVVVGATPAGIMCAVAGARLGSSVALVEYHGNIGGMSASGLGKSDIENKEAIAGMFKEFTHRVHQYYLDKYGPGSSNEKLCREGYYYEPSVAGKIFNEMVKAESNIDVFLAYQIEDARTAAHKLVAAVFKSRHGLEHLSLKAGIFVDATYEGDLYAIAGAAYRLGREHKNTFGELHAGKIFFHHEDKVILPGSTGKGDDNLPAYTYRLCLTDDPGNCYVLREPPPGYHRDHYTKYLDDLEAGRLGGPKVHKDGHGYYAEHFNTMVRVFSFTALPNRKYDVNINPRPLGFPFPGENRGYVESDWETRERIMKKHRELVLGLLYFIQNDAEIPEKHRQMARKYHLPLDEFQDNEHFPWQFYVREARRLKGRYTLTENDFKPSNSSKRSTVFYDSIMAGEFPIDSFPVTREPSDGQKVLEGYICMLEIAPYHVPLRILLPETMGGLIVPVAASTSHVAYSTIRMEPLWMGLGHVAGLLAHLSIKMQLDPHTVPIHLLQKKLLEHNQVLTYFHDLDLADKAFRAAQFWGTKGFFPTYYAKLHESLAVKELIRWFHLFEKALEEEGKNTVPGIEMGESVVRISEFMQLLLWLGARYELWDEEGRNSYSLTINGHDWLYGSRNAALPVQKGEVCLALFHLFFLIKSKTRYGKV
jgi:hypothetical protein